MGNTPHYNSDNNEHQNSAPDYISNQLPKDDQISSNILVRYFNWNFSRKLLKHEMLYPIRTMTATEYKQIENGDRKGLKIKHRDFKIVHVEKITANKRRTIYEDMNVILEYEIQLSTKGEDISKRTFYIATEVRPGSGVAKVYPHLIEVKTYEQSVQDKYWDKIHRPENRMQIIESKKIKYLYEKTKAWFLTKLNMFM